MEHLCVTQQFSLEDWKESIGLTNPRREFGLCGLNNSLYAIGGYGRTGEALSTVERFDSDLEKWVEVSPTLVARAGLSLCVVDNKIFVAGGGDNSIEVYDPHGDEWTPLVGAPDLPFAVKMCSLQQYVYVAAKNFFLRLDTVSSEWTHLVPLSSDVDNLFALNSLLYFTLANDTTECYDPLLQKWIGQLNGRAQSVVCLSNHAYTTRQCDSSSIDGQTTSESRVIRCKIGPTSGVLFTNSFVVPSSNSSSVSSAVSSASVSSAVCAVRKAQQALSEALFVLDQSASSPVSSSDSSSAASASATSNSSITVAPVAASYPCSSSPTTTAPTNTATTSLATPATTAPTSLPTVDPPAAIDIPKVSAIDIPKVSATPNDMDDIAMLFISTTPTSPVPPTPSISLVPADSASAATSSTSSTTISISTASIVPQSLPPVTIPATSIPHPLPSRLPPPRVISKSVIKPLTTLPPGRAVPPPPALPSPNVASLDARRAKPVHVPSSIPAPTLLVPSPQTPSSSTSNGFQALILQCLQQDQLQQAEELLGVMDRMGAKASTSTLKALLDVYLKQEQLDKAENMLNRLESAGTKSSTIEDALSLDSSTTILASPTVAIHSKLPTPRALPSISPLTIHTATESNDTAPEKKEELVSAIMPSNENTEMNKPPIQDLQPATATELVNPKGKTANETLSETTLLVPGETAKTEPFASSSDSEANPFSTFFPESESLEQSSMAPKNEKEGFNFAELFEADVEKPPAKTPQPTPNAKLYPKSIITKHKEAATNLKEETKKSSAASKLAKPKEDTKPEKPKDQRRNQKTEESKTRVPANKKTLDSSSSGVPQTESWVPKEDLLPESQLRMAFQQFGGNEESSSIDAATFLAILHKTETQLNSRRQTTLADAQEFLSMVCPDGKFESFCEAAQSMAVIKKLISKLTPETPDANAPLAVNMHLATGPTAVTEETKALQQPALAENAPATIAPLSKPQVETKAPQVETKAPRQIDQTQLATMELPEPALVDLFTALGGEPNGFISLKSFQTVIDSVSGFEISPGQPNSPESVESFLRSFSSRADGQVDFASFCGGVRTVPALCRLIGDFSELDLSDSDGEL